MFNNRSSITRLCNYADYPMLLVHVFILIGQELLIALSR